VKFITPSYKILKETDPFKQIESAARTCYKSSPKDDDTSQAFFNRLVKRKHFAMCEFATFVFHVTDKDLFEECRKQKFLNTTSVNGRMIVSGNLRALNECLPGLVLLSVMVLEHPELKPLAYSIGDVIGTPCKARYVSSEEFSTWELFESEKLTHSYMTVRFTTCRGCYSDDTYVLTKSGFKLFSQLSYSDVVMSLDDNHNIVEQPIKNIVSYTYCGKLMNFCSTQVDLAVTTDHMMYVFDEHKRSPATKTWKFLPAAKLNNKAYSFFKGGMFSYNGVDSETFTIPSCDRSYLNKTKCTDNGIVTRYYDSVNVDKGDFYELLGLWTTDGSVYIRKDTGNPSCVITQSKPHVRARLEYLLTRLSIPYSVHKSTYKIGSTILTDFIFRSFIRDGDTRKTHYISIPTFVKDDAPKYIQRYIDGCWLGNGTKMSDGRENIVTASYQFALDMVECLLKAGKSANICTNTDRRGDIREYKGHVFHTQMLTYSVNIVKTPKTYWKKDGTHSRGKKSNYSEIPYDGNVWCVELPEHHRLYVMRNGKGCWCGNCSHEIVRHREFSFAQESTRYVKYGKDPMEFLLPPWIQGDSREWLLHWDCMGINAFHDAPLPDDVKIFGKSCAEAESTYANLINNGWQPQQAREVLPNALKTEIVVCGNLAEWKHCFSLRCDKSAHPQIRELMIPLFNEIRAENPELWEDAAENINLEV